MPFLRVQAHSVTTGQHVMDKIRDAVRLLITTDQPIYATAKQIQWQWPEDDSESHFLVMFAGLHIEMTALHSLNFLAEGSCGQSYD